MIKKQLVFCTLLFSVFALSAQDFNKKLDSLKTVFKNSNNPEIRINASIELGKIYNRSHVDSAFIYFKKAMALSENENLIAKKVQSYSSIAASYIIKGTFDSAHYYFDKSEKLLNQVTDYKITTSFYGDKGILYYYEGDIMAAANNFKTALQISKENKDTPNIIKFSNNTALAYTQLGENNEAIDIYYDALKLAEKEADTDQIGKLLNNIGLVYENMNQYDEALKFYEKAFEIKKKSATQIDVANAYYNLANMQLKIGESNKDAKLIAKATYNFNQTLKISNENEYGNGKLYGLEGLGQIAINEKKYEEAKTIYTKMDSLSRILKNNPIIGVSNLKLGIIALEEAHYNVAKTKLFVANEIIETSGVQKDKAQLYGALNRYYIKMSNFKEAHHYLELQKNIEDALSSKSLQDKISNYEIKYQTEKKEKEILSQRANIAEKELHITQKNTQLIGLVVLVIVLSLLGYLLYNQQKLKNRQLKKESELKEALIKIESQNKLQEQRLTISRDLHDNIGAQLTFIISSIENLQYGFKITNEKLANKLTSISEFTKETIYELRDTIWAMNKNEISLEDLQIRISNFIDKANTVSVKTTFEFNIDSNISKTRQFTSVKGMNIYRIIQEAINNAMKYADATTISVEVKQINDKMTFSIVDNGGGFDKTKVVLGNGLNNMKKRTQDIGAELIIDSEVNKGTSVLLKV